MRQSQRKRVAKGKALNRSEADLFELTEIRGPDIERAVRDWKARTLPEARGLIDAILEEPDE